MRTLTLCTLTLRTMARLTVAALPIALLAVTGFTGVAEAANPVRCGAILKSSVTMTANVSCRRATASRCIAE